MTEGNIIKEVYLPNTNKVSAIAPDTLQPKTLEKMEKDYIISILNKCNGKVFGHGGAAEILGLNPSTLNSKMRKLGITKDVLYGDM